GPSSPPSGRSGRGPRSHRRRDRKRGRGVSRGQDRPRGIIRGNKMRPMNWKEVATVILVILGATIACQGSHADPASVAAIGDSITARYRLSYSYPDLLGRWREVPVRNFGVSGDTTAQMLDRLADVLDSGPTPQVVVIMGGTNDIARGMPVEGPLR